MDFHAIFNGRATTSRRIMRYSGATPLVPGPAAVAVLANGSIVAAERAFAFGVVERLLGSATSGEAPGRALNDLEWDLFGGVLERLFASAVASRGSDPCVAAVPPALSVAVTTHDVVADGFAGRIVVVEPAPSPDGRIEVAVGFTLEEGDLCPGAVLPLGGGELRAETGETFHVVLGSWRGQAAARIVH